MSILIDKIVGNEDIACNMREIDGKRYIARPLRFGSRWRLISLCGRFRDCWRVLTDRGLVIHYKEDE